MQGKHPGPAYVLITASSWSPGGMLAVINLLPDKGYRVAPPPHRDLAPGDSPARSALRLLTEYYVWRDAVGLDPRPADRARLRRMVRDSLQVGVVFCDWAGLPE